VGGVGGSFQAQRIEVKNDGGNISMGMDLGHTRSLRGCSDSRTGFMNLFQGVYRRKTIGNTISNVSLMLPCNTL
jgi:hypothetical protein